MESGYEGRHSTSTTPARPRHSLDAAGAQRRRSRQRARRRRRLAPALAALTVTGALAGGVVIAINLTSPDADNVAAYNPADNAPPADRGAYGDRADRSVERNTVTGPLCEASYYDQADLTASGEKFDADALTTGHPTLPFGTRLKVSNAETGVSVEVKVNDRGPAEPGRCLELSKAAFAKLEDPALGVVEVQYQVLKD